MIYRNIEIPSNFKYIAEISDNYIIWVRENKLNNNTDYQAYIQFINPSFSYLFVDDYRIKNGDNYIYNANYINNGMYSYIDSYDLEYSLNTILTTSGDYLTTEYGRADFPNIFICGMILVFIFTLLLIRLTPKTRR